MQDPSPRPLDLRSPLVQLIGAARRQVRQAFWTRFAPLGLAPQQGWILRVLGAQGAMSLHGLAQWVHMDDPTACRVVKSLQEKGLVESAPDPRHGRKVIISLAPPGQQLVAQLDAAAAGLEADLHAGLSPAEQLSLRSGLLKVIGNLAPTPLPGKD